MTIVMNLARWRKVLLLIQDFSPFHFAHNLITQPSLYCLQTEPSACEHWTWLEWVEWWVWHQVWTHQEWTHQEWKRRKSKRLGWRLQVWRLRARTQPEWTPQEFLRVLCRELRGWRPQGPNSDSLVEAPAAGWTWWNEPPWCGRGSCMWRWATTRSPIRDNCPWTGTARRRWSTAWCWSRRAGLGFSPESWSTAGSVAQVTSRASWCPGIPRRTRPPSASRHCCLRGGGSPLFAAMKASVSRRRRSGTPRHLLRQVARVLSHKSQVKLKNSAGQKSWPSLLCYCHDWKNLAGHFSYLLKKNSPDNKVNLLKWTQTIFASTLNMAEAKPYAVW